jgi:hypothetical protein
MRIRIVCLLWAVLGFFNNPARAADPIFFIDTMLGTQVRTFTIPDPADQTQNVTAIVTGGALVSVDSVGNRVVVSDFGNPGQGPISNGYLSAVALAPSGLLSPGQALLALDTFGGTKGQNGFGGGALFVVDPTTGQRTMLSDFGNPAQGPTGLAPLALVVCNGLAGLGSSIYVVDNSAGTNNAGAIFRVDPATGNRTLFSDLGNTSQGPGINPRSIAIAPAGLLGLNAELLVLDKSGGTNGIGTILAVDSSGNRTVLSDLGNTAQGQPAVGPQQIAVMSGLLGLGTTIYLTDSQAGSNGGGAVLRIDPATGNRTRLSDFDNSGQGPGVKPTGIAIGDGGNLLVTDDEIAKPSDPSAILQIDPTTGQRTIDTDCTNAGLGPCRRPVALTQTP